jgi:hypothetical protein
VRPTDPDLRFAAPTPTALGLAAKGWGWDTAFWLWIVQQCLADDSRDAARTALEQYPFSPVHFYSGELIRHTGPELSTVVKSVPWDRVASVRIHDASDTASDPPQACTRRRLINEYHRAA